MSLAESPRLAAAHGAPLRHDWTRDEVRALFELPFPGLMFRAQSVHRDHFDPAAVQISTLLSIKTGGCPEDCAYCPQSAEYETGVRAEKLMRLDAVLAEARAAKAAGASRFCMGAAWRSPKDRDLDSVCAMVEGVKALGLETCATLGMLTATQAQQLRQAGLDYYNHNLDTSPEFYEKIITTRTYRDRLETLEHVRAAGINVCCGGIVGMGETREDRVSMIATLASLPEHPESVPINMLVRVAGTPLAGEPSLDTSPEFYEKIITTRTYRDRLETLEHVRDAGIHVCCGGIVGMGETREDRIGMIATLASLPEHPESVPINMLVRVAGTPLAGEPSLDPIEFVRTIAVARITMPRSMVRLSAGRETMTEETQALCFLAGANSIFYGPKLLTTPNPERGRDQALMDRLGLTAMAERVHD